MASSKGFNQCNQSGFGFGTQNKSSQGFGLQSTSGTPSGFGQQNSTASSAFGQPQPTTSCFGQSTQPQTLGNSFASSSTLCQPQGPSLTGFPQKLGQSQQPSFNFAQNQAPTFPAGGFGQPTSGLSFKPGAAFGATPAMNALSSFNSKQPDASLKPFIPNSGGFGSNAQSFSWSSGSSQASVGNLGTTPHQQQLCQLKENHHRLMSQQLSFYAQANIEETPYGIPFDIIDKFSDLKPLLIFKNL
ncbi:nucleoporin NUP42-like isoform X2 [Zophobas morio]|uniref:nucleoporin NUP42-like isoform X2 n=1 Tax=Zophobas morio TaxID=2755281 RepID=UPI0030835B04